MATAPVTAADRRHRRRQETIEEILDIMAKIMADEGVAGLSVGEIARRMGIRPPSVHGYFPSNHALLRRAVRPRRPPAPAGHAGGGVVSQQLANAPQQAFDEGCFTAAVPVLVSMFAGHYSPRIPAPKGGGHRGKR